MILRLLHLSIICAQNVQNAVRLILIAAERPPIGITPSSLIFRRPAS